MKNSLINSLKTFFVSACVLCMATSFSFSQQKESHYQWDLNLGWNLGEVPEVFQGVSSNGFGALHIQYGGSEAAKVNLFQLFASPQIGLDCKTWKEGSIYVTVGYRYEYVNNICVRLGFTF